MDAPDPASRGVAGDGESAEDVDDDGEAACLARAGDEVEELDPGRQRPPAVRTAATSAAVIGGAELPKPPRT